MTDKEITKALECCAGVGNDVCTDCPLFDVYDCESQIKLESYNIIKKLKNREKRYQKKIKFQRSALRKQQEEISHLKTVIEMQKELNVNGRILHK